MEIITSFAISLSAVIIAGIGLFWKIRTDYRREFDERIKGVENNLTDRLKDVENNLTDRVNKVDDRLREIESNIQRALGRLEGRQDAQNKNSS